MDARDAVVVPQQDEVRVFPNSLGNLSIAQGDQLIVIHPEFCLRVADAIQQRWAEMTGNAGDTEL